jgi:transposase
MNLFCAGGTMARKMLRNDQWAKLKDMLPGKPTDCGVTAADNRQFLEAVLWIMRTGAPWRDLPDEYGRWHTVYMRFSRWAKKGVWQRIADTIATDPDFEWVAIDSTIVRAHQHAAGAKGGSRTKR